MTSRLDRLLLLLDTGSSASIRATAAKQIGQLAAKGVRRDVGEDDSFDVKGVGSSPLDASEWTEVMVVVARILPMLHSRSFETRTAAATALSHICSLVPIWSPPASSFPSPESFSQFPAPEFPSFSVPQLLRTAPLLLASSGKEFAKPTALGTPADIGKARREAMSRLGIDFFDETDPSGWEKELLDEAGDIRMEDVKTDVVSTSIEGSIKMEDPGKSEEDNEIKQEDAPMVINPDSSRAVTTPNIDSAKSQDASPTISVDPQPDELSALSARERNRLKRKRKPGNNAFVPAIVPPPAPVRTQSQPQPSSSKVRLVANDHGKPLAKKLEHTPLSPSGTPAVLPGTEKVIIDPSKGGQVDPKDKAGAQAKILEVKDGTWVWEGVVNVLEVDLFSANWEVRHGAALALREVIKSQGASGGMKASLPREENAALHEKWCNDLAAKFLCVFVLDRFGDFVSDQVVAPVRETVSQTLASLLLHMPRRSIIYVHSILLQMIKQDFEDSGQDCQAVKSKNLVWEVRHAGLLGMKYEVAVRTDLIDVAHDGQDILKGVVDAAVLGLSDQDDDVRSVAASCLLPIAGNLVDQLPEEISRVLDVLWNCLADMKDDLSSSVGVVMDLLGKLVSFEQVIRILADEKTFRPLSDLTPTLFPFFRHTIPNVRLAVVKTLYSFLMVPSLSTDWINTIYLRLLYQNLLLEERQDVREASLQAWRVSLIPLRMTNGRLEHVASKAVIFDFFAAMMTPLGLPIPPAHLYILPGTDANGQGVEKHNVDKHMLCQDLTLIPVETVWKARIATGKALALLLNQVPPDLQVSLFDTPLKHYWKSPSMLQKFLTATIMEEWATEHSLAQPNIPLISISPLADEMGKLLIESLQADLPPAYHEMSILLSRIYTDCQALLNGFTIEAKVPPSKIPVLDNKIDTTGSLPGHFHIETAKHATGPLFEHLRAGLGKTKKKEVAKLEESRRKVLATIHQYASVKEQHDTRVAAAMAAASIALKIVPSKLTPLIRSVMNGVKHEENIDLQTRSATAVASFVAFCTSQPNPLLHQPPEKVIKNLCTFLCQDTRQTPVFAEDHKVREGILSYNKAMATALAPSSIKFAKASAKEELAPEPEHVQQAKLMRRGAEIAFVQLSTQFGSALFETVPKIWQSMSESLLSTYVPGSTPEDADAKMETAAQTGQDVLDSLTVVQAIAPRLHPSLMPRLSQLFPSLVLALRSRFAIVRQAAARCFATICDVDTADAMRHVVEYVVPFLGDAVVLVNRQGAIELIFHIVNKLDIKALPYVIFMIVPVLGRMSDSDEDTRSTATNTFATLVKMVPLEAGLPDPPGFSEELLRRRQSEREFLTQLLDGSKVEVYRLPVPINAELRKYQQDGINWLAFLARYQLHGILCDDMGLGKTLQSICILASKQFERSQRGEPHIPSLIICPPTLTGHWYYEILKYTTTLRPFLYTGTTRDRRKHIPNIQKFDVIITSYDVIRNDISELSTISWFYCILDEGHIIKNAKTKLTQAVKQVRSQHRLILSGTPIQNNVLELWSLFDFLMPGFLGSESSFNDRFGKPILANRDGKGNAKSAEAAALALEALHKQVLPFLLRRLKEDVLNDLPPKIIQDYYCELSDLQKQLYDEFSHSQAQSTAMEVVQANGNATGDQRHVFQSLQYLRKLCNHPALVLKDDGDAILAKLQTKHVTTKGDKGSGTLRDIHHAPKLLALKQLLTDCGIGLANGRESNEPMTTEGSDQADPILSQHRVLIFCQMKQMLDIIETDLFKTHMPSVTYMRLDGGTEVSKRHAIVQTFNTDPSIDCLLLTTHVGGLGLTLTGADTVIFVEHDWNPMKDLQAMDRAHRLGQKKVVNVYRLITKGTLEEKIMGLQRFKLNIANSVITQQNSGLASMGTDLVLDLFRRTTEEDAAVVQKKKDTEGSGPVTQKNVLDGLEDLPAEEEYEGLDLSSFMGSLGR